MSQFNHQKYRPFPILNKHDRQWPSQMITQAPLWCAVDLRDGNQALIEPMNVAQKRQMWQLLVNIGFKHIEIGFPAASQPDFEFCRWLIEEHQIPDDVTIQVLVQARDALIERTYEALKGAKKAIVHVYNSTSPVQRKKVFNLDREGIKEIARKGAQKVLDMSKQFPETEWSFEYSPESFSSTEIDFSIDICNAVIDVWQPTPDHKAIMNLPATVECATPNVFADQVETFCQQINHRDSILVSIHTHNDRGCAVAAAELAILAGADRIEGTLMGNGERTGNMDLVTMAMNLYSQGIDPAIDISNAAEIMRVVEHCTQIKTHPRHPWFGELVYTAFSGSHQDAIRKCLAQQDDNDAWDVAYLPINPADLGRDYQSVIRVNSQSGKGGVAYLLEHHYGLSLPRWMQIEVSQHVQSLAENSSTEVNADAIWKILQDKFMSSANDTCRLQEYILKEDNNEFELSGSFIKEDTHINFLEKGDDALDIFCTALQSSLELPTLEVMAVEHQTATKDNKVTTFLQTKIDNQRLNTIQTGNNKNESLFNTLILAVNQYLT